MRILKELQVEALTVVQEVHAKPSYHSIRSRRYNTMIVLRLTCCLSSGSFWTPSSSGLHLLASPQVRLLVTLLLSKQEDTGGSLAFQYSGSETLGNPLRCLWLSPPAQTTECSTSQIGRSRASGILLRTVLWACTALLGNWWGCVLWEARKDVFVSFNLSFEISFWLCDLKSKIFFSIL